jgi:hypothetical protein
MSKLPIAGISDPDASRVSGYVASEPTDMVTKLVRRHGAVDGPSVNYYAQYLLALGIAARALSGSYELVSTALRPDQLP